MFPQFPLSTIVADLLRTGVPEVTVDNLISRPPPRAPLSPPVSILPSTSTSTSGMTTANRSWFGMNPRPNQTNTESSTSSPASTSPSSSADEKGTTGDPVGSDPETILARRRRRMLDEARERFFSRNAS
ncbi:hypothetical protein D915_000359 [Fasciola hepatica]|uniref:CUE domain-containing protein n=1 Tax=Fasciola hepatica TaxID=6192 RepID=A0A4E0RKC1_FASHE|nr:hypothetical protein D915_000359 [Fasciola hepatica]